MKKLLLLLLLCPFARLHAQTVQCQTSNGAWGPCPLNASVQLFTTQTITSTETSTPQKVYNFSHAGSLIATWASISGSPSGCTLQMKSGDSLGNLINNGSAVSVTPSNGTTITQYQPTYINGDEIETVYACSSYPSAGTLSLEFVPNTISAQIDSTGHLIIVGEGTAGSAAGGVMTIQGVSSMTPVQVSQATASNLNATVTGSGTAGSAASGVVTVQGISGGTTLPVTNTQSGTASQNVAQFGGNNVVTGTGASGSGVPRVTISNDSSLAANQSVNDNEVGGSAISTAASGTQLVGIEGHAAASVDAAAGATAATNSLEEGGVYNSSAPSPSSGQQEPLQEDSSANLKVNIAAQTLADVNVNTAQVGGSSVSTAATGVQKVGFVGNAGAAVDQAPGSAAPANAVQIGLTDGTDTRAWLSDTTGRPFIKPYPDTTTGSYTAAVLGLSPASSATDIACIPGNATTKVLVNRIQVTFTQTTAGIDQVQLIKRSAANTGGTSSNLTVVPDYSSYSAADSTPLSYTANPTTGSAVGTVDAVWVGGMATSTTTPNDIYIFKPMKPIILSGTAQELCVNLNSATISGGSFDISFAWEETTTP